MGTKNKIKLSNEGEDTLEFIIAGAKMVHKDQLDEPIEDQMSVEDIVWNIMEDRREDDIDENIKNYGEGLPNMIKWMETNDQEEIDRVIKAFL